MPYFRRNRNRTNRYRKRLSKASILSNRSARSQSRQIALLSSKVNRINRTLRPEIRTGYLTFDNEFTNSSLSSNWNWQQINPWLNWTGSDGIDQGQNFKPQGNYITTKGLTIRMVSQYSDNYRFDISQSIDHDASAGYRILIVQRKSPIEPSASSTSFDLDNFFRSIASSTSSSDNNLVVPLTDGITQYWKVLFLKTYTISRQSPTRSHVWNFSERQLLNMTREVSNDGASLAPKGGIYIVILTGGLHYDTDYSARIRMTWSAKLAFTDS